MTSRVRTLFIIGLFFVAVLAVLYPLLPLLGFAVGLIYPGYYCDTQSRGSVHGISGYDFEISETACDVIAKDDAITIFASQAGARTKTPIFKYDPGGDELPTIEAIDAYTIRVSLRSISSVYFRKDSVGDLSISYDIGHIYYPGSGDRQ